MTNPESISTKIAIAATFLGLGGLGGFAMASNPAYTQQDAAPKTAVVQPAAQGAATSAAAPATKPVSTHTSGSAPTIGNAQAVPRSAGHGLGEHGDEDT